MILRQIKHHVWIITASWTFTKVENPPLKNGSKYISERLYMEALGLWRLSYVFNIDIGIIYSQLKAYCSQRTLEYTDGGNPIKEKTWQHLISVHACLIQHPDIKKETESKTIGASWNVLSWPASRAGADWKGGMWFVSELQAILTCLWDKMWAKQWKNVSAPITSAYGWRRGWRPDDSPGPIWALGGGLLCSRVPRRWCDGVLTRLPLPALLPNFVCNLGSNMNF